MKGQEEALEKKSFKVCLTSLVIVAFKGDQVKSKQKQKTYKVCCQTFKSTRDTMHESQHNDRSPQGEWGWPSYMKSAMKSCEEARCKLLYFQQNQRLHKIQDLAKEWAQDSAK